MVPQRCRSGPRMVPGMGSGAGVDPEWFQPNGDCVRVGRKWFRSGSGVVPREGERSESGSGVVPEWFQSGSRDGEWFQSGSGVVPEWFQGW